MLNLSTTTDTIKYLVQTYGPLFPAAATTIAAIVAAFAARAANRSAHASEENVETAKQSMEISNRAYLTITGVQLAGDIQSNQKPRASTTFKNVGRTPARNVTTRSEIAVVPTLTSPVPELPESSEILSVGSDQTITINTTADVSLTQEDVDAVKNETKVLFYWGQLTYEDVFGHKHITTWRLTYSENASGKLRLRSSGNDIS